MPTALTPTYRITYEGTDITEDLTGFIIAWTYIDNTEGESDELQLTVDDTDGNWRGAWNPEKGDKIIFEFGYDDALVPGGTFTVDEIELSGPPDQVNIRALAAGINSPLRTKVSTAFEDLSLQQVVEKIAERNDLTVEGTIPNIQITRETQNRETDLEFLHRLSKRWGVLFSVRDDRLIFTDIFAIEESKSITSIDRTELKTYRINDKTISTYKEAKVAYADSLTNALVAFDYPAPPGTQQRVYTWDYFLANIVFYLDDYPISLVRKLYGDLAADLFADVRPLIADLSAKITAGAATISEAVNVTLEVEKRLLVDQIAAFWTQLGIANFVESIRTARRFLLEQQKKNPNDPVNTSFELRDIRQRVESRAQAERMARSLLNEANSNAKTGTFSMEGNPLLLAGSNFDLTGFGRYSSVCHIINSTHDFSRGQGYSTTVEVKMLDELTDDRQN